MEPGAGAIHGTDAETYSDCGQRRLKTLSKDPGLNVISLRCHMRTCQVNPKKHIANVILQPHIECHGCPLPDLPVDPFAESICRTKVLFDIYHSCHRRAN
jgi:hypothetical protein